MQRTGWQRALAPQVLRQAAAQRRAARQPGAALTGTVPTRAELDRAREERRPEPAAGLQERAAA
ncbi:hypothetical protein, partial [Mycobacterium noviomagense]